MTAMGWFITADAGEFLPRPGRSCAPSPRAGYRPIEDRAVFSFESAIRR